VTWEAADSAPLGCLVISADRQFPLFPTIPEQRAAFFVHINNSQLPLCVPIVLVLQTR